jgi:hypothetical protein
MAQASRRPGTPSRHPWLPGSPSNSSAGAFATRRLAPGWLAHATEQRSAAAVLLLAMLLAACATTGSEPLARPNDSEPAGAATGPGTAVPEDACPQMVACTAGSATEPRGDDGSPLPIVDPGPCRDEDACAEGFLVGDDLHAVSCGAVRPELVTDEVVARGTWAGDVREVRVIGGVDPDVLLAIDMPAGECADGEVVLSDFSMVIVGRYDPSRAQEAICVAAVDEHLARNGC